MKSRLISAIIAGVYIGGALLTGEAEQVFTMCLFLLIPLGLIWYSEEIGNVQGWLGWRFLHNKTHPSMVALAGWIILFLPIILLLWLGPDRN